MKRATRNIKETPKVRGRVNSAKLATFTEADIKRFAREDESDTSDLGKPRYVPPRTDVRELRKRLGLSQAQFARRYLLSVRTVQQWEQALREPSEPARILLFAIEQDPVAIARVLRSRKRAAAR